MNDGNMDDQGTWKDIDQPLRNLLIEKGPREVLRNKDLDFLRGAFGRHFFHVLY